MPTSDLDKALSGVYDFESTMDPDFLNASHKKYDEDQKIVKEIDDEAIMWWALDTEPLVGAKFGKIEDGSSLWPMVEALKIYPFKNRKGEYFIFDGNYRVAADEPLTAEALTAPVIPEMSPDLPPPPAAAEKIPSGSKIYLIMNFIAGFMIEAVEMLVAVGQYSSLPVDGKAKVIAQDGGDKKHAPKSEDFFEWPDEEKVLLNKMYKRTKETEEYKMEVYIFARRAAKLARHWWLQLVLFENSDRKWPVPGEFIGLGVKMMPDVPWGLQKSSPFIYSGHWVDTFYYTSGVITEVIPPTDTVAYPTYKVNWQTLSGDNAITMKPSDFAEYKVGDRVTVLKDVSVKMESGGAKFQTSEDADTKPEFNREKWMICPITFYNDMGKQEA
jgi:hypothetical protein